MFVELIDQLRCPEPHADSWLVMSAEETRDRHVIRGSLGCPVCLRRYTVENGTVHFDGRAEGHAPAAATTPPANDDWPLRLAAFLDLAEGGGAVGLYGAWAQHAEALGDVVERVVPLAIAPREATHPMLSAVVPPSRAQIPVATGALRAVAVDRAGDADAPAVVTEAARLVRPGGRILAPAEIPVPAGVREIARDAEWWVGEREAGMSSGVVPIAGRRRPAGT